MTSYSITQIPAPRTPLIDETTGLLSREWFRWFNNINNIVGSGLGVIAVINGGTGQSTYTNGQLLIGNNTGNTLSKNTLTPGTGIGVTNGPGSISIANTGVLSIVAGAGISASPSTGNVTVANTGVTSFSAGTTGLTPNSPTTGSVVLAGTLAIANGGTGATTDAGARTNLGLGTIATQNANNVNITGGSISGITDLAIADGGTGASDAATARTNLGLGSGLSVTITTAKLTVAGANGSMTFVNGILTAQTQAT